MSKWIPPQTMTICLMLLACICIVAFFFSLLNDNDVSEVPNYLLSLLALIHASLYSFERIQINWLGGEGGGVLIYPKPQWCSGTETIEVRELNEFCCPLCYSWLSQ